jgi:hypothetical protein
MNKSDIIFKAVNEYLYLGKLSDKRSYWPSTYLCHAIEDTKEPKSKAIFKAIDEDLEYNRAGALAFTDKDGKRDQMQIATYGLFLSEYFKNTK